MALRGRGGDEGRWGGGKGRPLLTRSPAALSTMTTHDETQARNRADHDSESGGHNTHVGHPGCTDCCPLPQQESWRLLESLSSLSRDSPSESATNGCKRTEANSTPY
eukprot:2077198-Rhodomonas_salina.1